MAAQKGGGEWLLEDSVTKFTLQLNETNFTQHPRVFRPEYMLLKQFSICFTLFLSQNHARTCYEQEKFTFFSFALVKVKLFPCIIKHSIIKAYQEVGPLYCIFIFIHFCYTVTLGQVIQQY
jgi:hypothetical protein